MTEPLESGRFPDDFSAFDKAYYIYFQELEKYRRKLEAERRAFEAEKEGLERRKKAKPKSGTAKRYKEYRKLRAAANLTLTEDDVYQRIYVNGYSVLKIAGELGMDQVTVRKHKSEAQKKINKTQKKINDVEKGLGHDS